MKQSPKAETPSSATPALSTQTLKALENLAAGVAQDFDGLLNVIAGYSQLLLSENPGAAARRKLEGIREAAERATALTQQLRVFSGRQALDERVYNVNEIISALRLMLSNILGGDVTLEIDLSYEPLCVMADRAQIENAIVNLAINAREAMPHGGSLKIETMKTAVSADSKIEALAPGAYAAIRVSDTGHGIALEDQLHIFEPFFSTKPKGHGNGLGLSIVHGVAAQCGGGVAYRTSPEGTSFTIYLPYAPAPKAAGGAISGELPCGNETILIVGDETGGHCASEILADCGYRVLTAASMQDAYAVWVRRRRSICLLITDLVMPGMSGTAFAEKLRTEHPGLPVLLLAGPTDDVLANARLKIARDVLEKSFTPDALIQKVRRMIDSVPALRRETVVRH